MGLYDYLKELIGRRRGIEKDIVTPPPAGVSVTERYVRDGRTYTVYHSRRTFKGESYEKWLARLGLDPSIPVYKGQYEKDYYSRGFMTEEQEAEFCKKQGWPR